MGASSSKQNPGPAGKVVTKPGDFAATPLHVDEKVMDCGIEFMKDVSGQQCGSVGAVIALLTALGKLDKGVANFIEGASADALKRDAELLAKYMKATLAAIHVAADLSIAVADASEQVQHLSIALSMLNDENQRQNAFNMIKSINSQKLVLPDTLLDQLRGAIQDYEAVINLCEGKLREEVKHANKKSDRYLLLSALCMFGALVVIGATIAVPLAAPAALAATYGLIIGSAVAVGAAGVVLKKATSHTTALTSLQRKLKEQGKLVESAETAAKDLKTELKFVQLKVQALQGELRRADGVVDKVRVFGEHATLSLLTLDNKRLLEDLVMLDQAANKLHTLAIKAFHEIAQQAKFDSKLVDEVDKELDALLSIKANAKGKK